MPRLASSDSASDVAWAALGSGPSLVADALDSGAGVFGALAFVAVREEESETGGFSPLVFGGDDELVDDDLGAVGEVAVLGFPEDEGFGGFDAVAVFEA